MLDSLTIRFRAVAIVLALAAAALVLDLRASRALADTGSRCTQHLHVIRDGFPEPRVIFSRDGRLETTLRASAAAITVDHESVPTLEYNHSLPGPTLVACPGDHVVVQLVNHLQDPTNLHVHGLHVSPRGNGDNVFTEIAPNKSFTYSYRLPADHPAGSYWYHPHLHMLVDRQIAAGLAGAIVVEGRLDNYLRKVPQRLMVIQGGLGQLTADAPAPGPAPLLVNGAVDPRLKIRPGQLQRWRILNATNNRFLKLSLAGQSFELLAEDGNTLRSMRRARVLVIPPGSRREVLVRGRAAGQYELTALPFQYCFKTCTDPYAGVPSSGARSTKQRVLTVVSSGRRSNDPTPDARLPYDLGDLRHSHVDRHRTVVFGEMARLGPPSFMFNGKAFDPNRVDVTMKLGSVEQWTLRNPVTDVQDEWHTFHIHQNPFQVISINGRRLPYVDWEDNVALPPGSTVVIRMRPIDFTGKFVFHCHLVFHEDHGMMGVVKVVRRLTPAQTRAGTVRAGAFTIASSAYESPRVPRLR